MLILNQTVFSRSQLTVWPEVARHLLEPTVCVDACKFSFANRVFTVWNNLPATVVDSVNVNFCITRLNTASLSQYCIVVYFIYVQTLTVLYSVTLISRSSCKLSLIYISYFILYQLWIGSRVSVFGPSVQLDFLPINVMLCYILIAWWLSVYPIIDWPITMQ